MRPRFSLQSGLPRLALEGWLGIVAAVAAQVCSCAITKPDARGHAQSGTRAQSSVVPLATPSAGVGGGAALGTDKPAAAAPLPIWRAGSPLAAPPALGPDGAIYVAGRQGTLDVLEASGIHRFTITLGGAPTGNVFVDERGWAYVGLATGKLLGITSAGQKFFAFQLPTGIRRGVGFAEGQGLLVLGQDQAVIGVNRGGFPTMRVAVHDETTVGPIGIPGWCVVGTAKGDILWGDRMGRRHRASLGASLRDLQPTFDGGIWALADDALTAFSTAREVVYRRDATLAMATAPRAHSIQGVQGGRLTSELELEWLGSSGNRVASRPIEAPAGPRSTVTLAMDDYGRIWITQAGRLRAYGIQGDDEPLREFDGRDLLAPVFDADRRRTVVSTVDGEVFVVDWTRRSPPPAG